ncbi:MAG TPA: hypothetical protein VH008_18525 [Pseudonocardia sp.]|jgi:hypothetical protein|nr:hypothetical protein [Pseudonocardia sp.]
MPAPLAVLATLAADPLPNPPPQAPPGLGELADQLIGWLKWGALTAGVVGLLICAGMILAGRRHRAGLAQDGLVGSFWVLTGLAMASLAAVLVGAFTGVVAP